jgi:hypothetical protein
VFQPKSLAPSLVSRQIKAGGVMTSGPDRRYKHEGVFVTRGWAKHVVNVAVDIDEYSHRKALAEAVEEILTAKGYAVVRQELEGWTNISVQRP